MLALELLIVAAVIAAVAYPIVKPAAEGPDVEEGDNYHQLLFRRDAVYQSIKELEFDYKTGKIDEDDYNSLKAEYQAKAVSILKSIDDMKTGVAPSPAGKDRSGPERREAPAKFCTQCGTGLEADAKFCSQCGNKLA